MNELERMGYLYSPHTSAGRVPTDRGLRYFVDALMVVDRNLMRQMDEAVASDIGESRDRERVLQNASEELARLTRFAGLVSVHEQGLKSIRRVELVPISADQVLAVIVGDDNEVQNRLLPRGRNMSDARLAGLSQRLSELLCDCDPQRARQRLLHEMESDRLRIRGMLDELVQWTKASARPQEEMIIRGQRQLLEVPELSVIDTVRSLMAAFEEKESLCGLIEQVEQSGSGVRVFIGSEHALVNMEQISVVLSKFEGPGKVMGTLGVIGPRRMHYERVLPVVDCTARWVSHVLGGWR